MVRGNALYEGYYLLGTAIARPLIAKRQIEIAKKYKADAVAHGATGKGNDQIRFELGYYYFNRKIKVISPWREWDFKSRSDLIKYAKKNNIPVPKDKKGKAPFSVDDNLFHTSTEGKILEDLNKNSLVDILTIPKNSLIKQYQKLFEMENVKLSFTKDALLSIADRSIIKKTGARGLRSILENILLDTMFKLPVLEDLEEVVVNAEVVKNNREPLQIFTDKKNKVDTSA